MRVACIDNLPNRADNDSEHNKWIGDGLYCWSYPVLTLEVNQ
jgi:hypothetical protein